MTISQAAQTVNDILVQSGGTLNRSGSAAQTLTLAGAHAASNTYAALECQPGSTCDLSSSATRPPLNITWSGNLATACGGASCAFGGVTVSIGGGVTSGFNTTLDATFAWTGQEKVVGNVSAWSDGAVANDYIECINVTPTPSPAVAVNDTIVFTSGLSKAFFYPVSCRPSACVGAGNPDACCTGANTSAGCGATACAGGACNLEITRNSTNASYNSHLMATGRDAANPRHATPLDSDANGTADSIGTQPTVGDGLVVYTPAVLAGGASPSTQGTGIYLSGVQANMRYLEFKNLSSADYTCQATCNTAAAGNCSQSGDASFAPIFWGVVNPTNSNGDISFINIHDWFADLAVEITSSDRTDSRPNYPVTYRYWYVHDPSSQIENCTDVTGCPGNCATLRLGEGIVISTDATGDNPVQKGLTMENIHVARVYGPPGLSIDIKQGTDANQWSSNHLREVLVHSIPKNATYPPTNPGNGGAVLQVLTGVDTSVEGATIFDLGNNTVPYRAINSRTVATNTSPAQRNQIAFRNIWEVNIDLNAAADGTASAYANDLASGQSSGNLDTSQVELSNSYISNVVGAAGRAGGLYYNYIHNVGIADAGGACGSTRTFAWLFPEDAVGNVIYRDLAGSCYAFAISYDQSVTDTNCSFTSRTHRAISNLLVAMKGNSGSEGGGLFYRTSQPSTTETCGYDFYNNLIDFNGATTNNGDADIDINQGHNNATATPFNVYYNLLMGSSGGGAAALYFTNAGGATLSHDYNRIYLSTAGTAITGGLSSHEIDSDKQDIVASRDFNFWNVLCSNPDRTRNPWGGPVGPLRFGVNSFDRFHPAAIKTMNADVFKMRYNWQSCSPSYQDSIPR